jgi:hypothetical protein
MNFKNQAKMLLHGVMGLENSLNEYVVKQGMTVYFFLAKIVLFAARCHLRWFVQSWRWFLEWKRELGRRVEMKEKVISEKNRCARPLTRFWAQLSISGPLENIEKLYQYFIPMK